MTAKEIGEDCEKILEQVDQEIIKLQQIRQKLREIRQILKKEKP